MNVERTPADGEGQGGLTCCSSWSCREQDTTQRLNNGNSSIHSNMDGAGNHPTQRSKSGKRINMVQYHLRVAQMNLPKEQSHRHREQPCGCPGGEGSGERIRDTNWYTEWISNRVLLQSTQNYIHHPVKNHNGKEYKKQCVCIYIYITESLCCTAETDTAV